jgi:hypothetical protein
MAWCFFKVLNHIFSFLKSSLVNISFKVGWHRHRIISSQVQLHHTYIYRSRPTISIRSLSLMFHYVTCSLYQSSWGNGTIVDWSNPPHYCTVDMEKVTVNNFVFWRFRVLSQFIVFIVCVFNILWILQENVSAFCCVHLKLSLSLLCLLIV